MGLSPEECTLDKQIVDPSELIEKMNTPKEEEAAE
jgi:heterodisulfide reductase subunit B